MKVTEVMADIGTVQILKVYDVDNMFGPVEYYWDSASFGVMGPFLTAWDAIQNFGNFERKRIAQEKVQADLDLAKQKNNVVYVDFKAKRKIL